MVFSRIIRSKHFPTLIAATGLFSFFGAHANSLYVRKKLDNPIIDETLNIIAQDPNAHAIVGPGFKIQTNLLSLMSTKINLDTPFGEAKFKIRGPKGEANVHLNTSSHTLEALETSSNAHFSKQKFNIPSKEISTLIDETINKEELSKQILNKKERFWSIDFVKINNKAKEDLVLKPKTQTGVQVSNLPRETLFDIYEEQSVF